MLGKKSHIVGRACDEPPGTEGREGWEVRDGEGAVPESVLNGII